MARDPWWYSEWVRNREHERTSRPLRVPVGAPSLCLLMVVGDADTRAITRSLGALRRQTSARWTLTAVTAADRGPEVEALVRASSTWRSRRRMRCLVAGEGTPDHELLRAGLSVAGGHPVALLFPGDVWAPDAVALLGGALTTGGVVYADEDILRDDGTHVDPKLKPDHSPDFLLTTAFVGRPLAVGAGLVGMLTGVDTDGAALEHDCALRACDAASSVTHVSEVLCHRTLPRGPIAQSKPSLRQVEEALRRHGEVGSVHQGPTPGTYRIARARPAGIVTSIVIPFRDEPCLLRTCVESIRSTTTADRVELLLVDNGSTDLETLTLIERLVERPRVRVLRDDRPFNWARLNNAAAAGARGDVLLFLNNDIEAHRSGWLDALCAQVIRPTIGAVGARLRYPGGRLQHCGIVVGMTGAAGHPLAGLAPGEPGYLGLATATRECSAVTGACLATRRAVFEELGGFDELLGVDLNDVDYCLRAWTAGYRTLFEPNAELVHHESPSRGTAGGVDDIVNFVERWSGYISEGDRYFNRRLTRADTSCGLARPDEEDSWKRWHSILTER